MTEFWILRHGQPADGFTGRCYGSLDVELSEEGIKQMEAASRIIPARSLSAIYCSPRSRCVKSAELLASRQSCPVLVVAALAEINFGDFEGHTYDEIARTHPDLYRQWMEQPTEVHFPGGESFVRMQERVLEADRELRSRHGESSYAIVAHGGVNRIILASALSMPNPHIFRIAQRYAAVNLIRYFGEYPSVELMNAG